MTKLYIKDMNLEELKKVFKANEKLRNDVYEDMIETEMSYIGEQLEMMRDGLDDWSIGAYQRNYMHVLDEAMFIQGVSDVQNSIPILIESDNPIYQEAERTLDVYQNIDFMEEAEDDIDEAEEEMMLAVEDLKETVLMRMTNQIDYCDEEIHQVGYFIEFYSDARLDADACYVDNEEFTLKEGIVKVYN